MTGGHIGHNAVRKSSAFTDYLFASEQFDPALGVYYNRARYYDQRQGRFWTMDTFEPSPYDPSTLHRYAYVPIL